MLKVNRSIKVISLIFFVIALIGCGGGGSGSGGGGSTPQDKIAPTSPISFEAVAGSSNFITFNWKASTDNVGVAGYYIYRDGSKIATVTTNSYVDTSLTPKTTYSYWIYAYDAAGNESAKNTSQITTPPASWKFSTIVNVETTTPGLDGSIAVDSNNKVHICYFDQKSKELKYATNASGSWVFNIIDTGGLYAVSMAIDHNDKLHIIYVDYWQGDLKYATNLTGSWIISTLDYNMEGYTAIAIDSNNKVHISYTAGLVYMTNASGSWVKTTISHPGLGETSTSIAVDSNNKVHIVTYNTTNGFVDDLLYATNASGSLVLYDNIDNSGGGKYDPSIAIDSNNKVHIVYNDTSQGAKYATNASGSWVVSTLNLNFYIDSLALDSNNKLHIINGGGMYGLKYATSLSGSWVNSTIVPSCSGMEDKSICIGPNDKIHVVCYDETYQKLKYATNL